MPILKAISERNAKGNVKKIFADIKKKEKLIKFQISGELLQTILLL